MTLRIYNDFKMDHLNQNVSAKEFANLLRRIADQIEKGTLIGKDEQTKTFYCLTGIGRGQHSIDLNAEAVGDAVYQRLCHEWSEKCDEKSESGELRDHQENGKFYYDEDDCDKLKNEFLEENEVKKFIDKLKGDEYFCECLEGFIKEFPEDRGIDA